MKYYTTFEQIKKLLNLGLKAESADMAYIESPIGEFIPVAYTPKETIVARDSMGSDAIIYPCWSVGALLEMMPKWITTDLAGYTLDIIPYDKSHYCIRYSGGHSLELHKSISETLLEATYNMVVWLLENNYIKKED